MDKKRETIIVTDKGTGTNRLAENRSNGDDLDKRHGEIRGRRGDKSGAYSGTH